MEKIAGKAGPSKFRDPVRIVAAARNRITPQNWKVMQNDPFRAMTDGDYIYTDEVDFSDLKYVRKMEHDSEIPMAAWDQTRGVYDFDASLRPLILDSRPLEAPAFLFTRLPEHGIYIRLEEIRGWQGKEYFIHGAFVSFSACFISDSPDIKSSAYGFITVILDNELFHHRFLMLNDDRTIGNMLHDGCKAEADYRTFCPAFVDELISYAAYLCTAKPDIRNPHEPRSIPQRKKNNGPVRNWEVGYRFGAAFRKQLAEAKQRASTGHGGDERNRPRVHVRRAHWHTILSGPLKEERKREVRWFPPVIVNAEGDDLPVTIWRQK